MRFLEFMKEYFKHHWIRLLVSTLYVASICILYNIINDGFAYRVSYSNGLFIGGATIFLFGLLTIVNYFGGFDIFSFMFNNKRVDGHRETLFDYSERKKMERKDSAFVFIDYLVIGTIGMIVSTIIYLTIT